MSRMLQALQHIDAKGVERPADVIPRSCPRQAEAQAAPREAPPPEDIDEAPPCLALWPAETAESIEVVRVFDPAFPGVEPEGLVELAAPPEAAGWAQQITSLDAPVPPTAPTDAATPPCAPAPANEAAKPERDIGRLLGQPVAEHDREYRALADNLVAQLPAGRSAALLFTSPGEGEEKSLTLAGLAAILAERVGDGVLVVDADFRRPRITELLAVGSPAGRGLVDVLLGAASWEEVIRGTGVAHLSVLPGGRFPTPDGLPPDRIRLAPLLDELQRHYRLVLVDAAPLIYPEVAPVARHCEGTYLVLELGRTGRRATRQALRLIAQCGGRVLGCIVTGV